MRRAISLLLLAFLVAMPYAALGQNYPERAIRIVVAFPPGGASDLVARTVGQKVSERVKQPVVIDNRGGASGTIASVHVMQSPADGYTVLFTAGTSHGTGSAFIPNLPYDPVKDFVAVAAAVEVVVGVAAHPSLPASSVRELIENAKRNPGKLSFGTPGTATPMHIAGELFKEAAGVDMVHVPYKGAAQAITDVLGGQITVAIGSLASILPHHGAGRVKILAVVESNRYKGLPDVPTIRETVPSYDMFSSWLGFFAPAGTSQALVERLNAEINLALADPGVRAKLEAAALVVLNTTPQQFAGMVKKELEIGARFAKALGAKP